MASDSRDHGFEADDASLRGYMFFNCTHGRGEPVPSWCTCRLCAVAWARERFAATRTTEGTER